MKWEFLYSGPGSAQHHMDVDQKLLQEIGMIDHPILRFYEWTGPCATYGYFIDPFQHLDRKGVEQWGLNLGRRPTGGGIVFHLADLAFSVLIPASHPAYSTNTLDNYAFINSRVAAAVINFKKGLVTTLLKDSENSKDDPCQHFCMAKPTIYDVMIAGKKVGGAAQRRTRDGFLHQGTISITLPEEALLKDVLKQDTEVFEAMKTHSFLLMESTGNEHEIYTARQELRSLLVAQFVA